MSKVAGYKIDIQKVALLYTDNTFSEKEIKKSIPFIIVSKTIKYLRINLTKEVKELSSENSRHWWTKLKKTQINGKVIHVHGLEEFILFKCHYYQKPSIESMQSQ